ncbi:MAG TPA: glycoside hydrolase family 2 TIM barrel-domain containing protein [Dinghuibacter sp.]|uniref:glycoside hydrolase family 2 TIM barrel-domain containing protein n=1 Tax=Dinghuibacter sp. TaxID=2024697 RepID=UPI002CE3BD53|nr:glycoside hydrolase family 2 TIM barrel-domain containing protein [Dinghuibacter sp.]HTJ10580.1 glycoside hydrolase family 2 TIM barrel-domain containing protein [Dinghuibacter sp.]
MRTIVCCLLLLSGCPIFAQRKLVLFDEGWKFHRGDVAGGERPDLADAGWRSVDLPHDWSIEDLPGTHSPFSPDVVNGVSQGFTTGGTGWYRKTFQAPASADWSLRFDGVYMDADVWLNGVHLGNHPYGYTSFQYDITRALRSGTNVLAVRVRNEGATSRWYPGSGIYRHVWLEGAPYVHVAPWGVSIRTDMAGGAAKVRVQTSVEGEASLVVLRTTLLDPDGKVVARQETNVASSAVPAATEQRLSVAHPILWSTRRPALYKAVTELLQDGKRIDNKTIIFGIRTISFDATHGFRLNGESIKLKGGCFHDDHGPLGSKSYDRAEERRVQLLLASGYNAIRCSHNPPAPAFLDACDRLGLLVIDEAFDCWDDGKNPQDYHLYFDANWRSDLRSMIDRDRNHPSIILWSIGNEIPNMDSARVQQKAHELATFVHGLDSTRGVIAAVNGPSVQRERFIDALDVAGYNYGISWSNWYEEDHGRHPDRVMLATESFPLEACKYWKAVQDHPYVVGDFVWTAWDYIGEASIGWRGYPQDKNFYPWNLAWCGDIDICGWKRPASYFRDALWHNGENISVFVEPPSPSFPVNPKKADWSMWNWFDVVSSWNWPGQEGKPLKVDVYSTCPEAELFLNGVSQGKKPVDKCVATWTVPYARGTLKVVGYRNGATSKSAVLETTGTPVAIRLRADRTHLKGHEDLSYVTVEVVDAQGRRVPTAANLIHFKMEGPGSIAGVGNGDPTSTESYTEPQRHCWEGRCLVILKSGANAGTTGKSAGTIQLTAIAEGLVAKTIGVTVE